MVDLDPRDLMAGGGWHLYYRDAVIGTMEAEEERCTQTSQQSSNS